MTDMNKNQRTEADALLFGSGGGVTASLKNVGDEVSGYVTRKNARQATTFGTNKPRFFDDAETQPIMELVLDLKTELRDPDTDGDDGTRTVFFKPQWKKELARVLSDAGETTLPLGSWLRIRRSHDEPGKGAEPKKHVTVEYRSAADTSIASAAPPAQPQAPAQPQTPAAPPEQGVAPNAELLAAAQANPELLEQLGKMLGNK